MARSSIITSLLPFQREWKIIEGRIDLVLRANEVAITDQSIQYKVKHIESPCAIANPRISNDATGIQRDLDIFLVIIIGHRKRTSSVIGPRDTALRIGRIPIVAESDSSIAHGGTILPLTQDITKENNTATTQTRSKHPRENFHSFFNKLYFSFDNLTNTCHNFPNISPHILLVSLLIKYIFLLSICQVNLKKSETFLFSLRINQS